ATVPFGTLKVPPWKVSGLASVTVVLLLASIVAGPVVLPTIRDAVPRLFVPVTLMVPVRSLTVPANGLPVAPRRVPPETVIVPWPAGVLVKASVERSGTTMVVAASRELARVALPGPARVNE